MALHRVVENIMAERISRIGKQPVSVPAGVEAQLNGQELSIKGPKGRLTLKLPENFTVVLKDQAVRLSPKQAGERVNALHGLYRSMVANMVTGVTAGYLKEMEIQGVGFKAVPQGRKILFSLGYSRPVEMSVPEGLDVKVVENVNLTVSGPDKQQVGDFAARIKALFPAEPYKGKGVRFKGEHVRRKVGKTVA